MTGKAVATGTITITNRLRSLPPTFRGRTLHQLLLPGCLLAGNFLSLACHLMARMVCERSPVVARRGLFTRVTSRSLRLSRGPRLSLIWRGHRIIRPVCCTNRALRTPARVGRLDTGQSEKAFWRLTRGLFPRWDLTRRTAAQTLSAAVRRGEPSECSRQPVVRPLAHTVLRSSRMTGVILTSPSWGMARARLTDTGQCQELASVRGSVTCLAHRFFRKPLNCPAHPFGRLFLTWGAGRDFGSRRLRYGRRQVRRR